MEKEKTHCIRASYCASARSDAFGVRVIFQPFFRGGSFFCKHLPGLRSKLRMRGHKLYSITGRIVVLWKKKSFERESRKDFSFAVFFH